MVNKVSFVGDVRFAELAFPASHSAFLVELGPELHTKASEVRKIYSTCSFEA